METAKYLIFYALLIAIIVLGAMTYHWLIIFPAGLVLAIGYVVVKGDSWRQVMGKSDMNAGLVFFATWFSQTILATILYGIGRLIAMMIN